MPRSRRETEPGNDPPDVELDLHGLTGQRALRRLTQELHAWRLRGVPRALVITGHGAQRDSEPVLAPLVEGWLATPDARALGVASWKPTHRGGAFEVSFAWAGKETR
jgi:DNA-nicking Smr family endonuclease